MNSSDLRYLMRRAQLVVCTGVGKSYKIAELCAALLQSVRVNAVAIHATDLAHGGMHMIRNESNVTLMFSHSGRTSELKPIAMFASHPRLITAGPGDYVLRLNESEIMRYDCPTDGSKHGTIPSLSLLEQMKIVNTLVCDLADELSREELAAGHPGGVLYEEN